MIQGTIFDIQRFSIHDGPGIRTTVFLKGCPLRCLWCHNPEAVSGSPQVAFYRSKCTGCGRCFDACPDKALTPGDARIDRAICAVCGRCVEACPAEALQMIGSVASVPEVMEVVLRDEPFYKTSGGGVTLSGGEPLEQLDFSHALLDSAKTSRLHTAVDTSGHGPWEHLERLVSLTDLFLYDLKLIDPQRHGECCGADNVTILENARRLSETGADIVFRTPVIPGVNDSASDLRLLGEFVLSMPGDQVLELLPYHATGIGKYDALGTPYPLSDVQSLETLDAQRNLLASMGVRLVNR